MYIWLGITILFLIVSIVFWILYKRSKKYIWRVYDNISNWIVAPLVFSLIMFIVLLMTCFVLFVRTREQVREFEMYQGMINEVYNEGDITDVGINSKIIDMNMWLLKARRSEDMYGKFSFYYGELDDLEYIKISTE